MRISNMKRLALAALAAGTALAAAPANATITLGYTVNGVGPVTVLATDAGTPGKASYSASIPGFLLDFGATGSPILTSPNLVTNSLNVKDIALNGQSGTLNLYITDSDMAAFNGSLMSSFTSNTLTGSVSSAVITSYYSAANALFGGTQLQTNTFNGLSTFAASNQVATGGLFSTTIRYDVVFGSTPGSFNGTANLNASAVPEPAAWMMMLIGFGAIGFGLRSRRTAKPRKVSFNFA